MRWKWSHFYWDSVWIIIIIMLVVSGLTLHFKPARQCKCNFHAFIDECFQFPLTKQQKSRDPTQTQPTWILAPFRLLHFVSQSPASTSKDRALCFSISPQEVKRNDLVRTCVRPACRDLSEGPVSPPATAQFPPSDLDTCIMPYWIRSHKKYCSYCVISPFFFLIRWGPHVLSIFFNLYLGFIIYEASPSFISFDSFCRYWISPHTLFFFFFLLN